MAAHVGERGAAQSAIETQDAALAARIEVAAHSVADPAILRAEFYGVASQRWHTLLHPSVKPGRTMVLLAGTYRFALNGDGTCCAFMLVEETTFRNAVFPASGATTVIAQAIAAGDITTQDISIPISWAVIAMGRSGAQT